VAALANLDFSRPPPTRGRRSSKRGHQTVRGAATPCSEIRALLGAILKPRGPLVFIEVNARRELTAITLVVLGDRACKDL
jgi:hypothetical protein